MVATEFGKTVLVISFATRSGFMRKSPHALWEIQSEGFSKGFFHTCDRIALILDFI